MRLSVGGIIRDFKTDHVLKCATNGLTLAMKRAYRFIVSGLWQNE